MSCAACHLRRESIIEQAAAAADGGHWNTFIRLMGGATVKRADLPLRLLKIDPKEARNRYGEERQDVTKGVFEEATGQVVITRVHEWVLQRSGEAASPRSPVNNCTPELAARHQPAFKPEWLGMDDKHQQRPAADRARRTAGNMEHPVL